MRDGSTKFWVLWKERPKGLRIGKLQVFDQTSIWVWIWIPKNQAKLGPDCLDTQTEGTEAIHKLSQGERLEPRPNEERPPNEARRMRNSLRNTTRTARHVGRESWQSWLRTWKYWDYTNKWWIFKRKENIMVIDSKKVPVLAVIRKDIKQPEPFKWNERSCK